MKQEAKTKLCPFKKITEQGHNDYTGKSTINERFALCAKERCIAYDARSGKCKRVEGNK